MKNQYIFTLNKLYWLKKERPELFQQAAIWHCVPDFISFKLTGRSGMDLSLASRTMMLDLKRKIWSEEILTKTEIKKDLMPLLVSSGSLIGSLTYEAAEKTGLHKDCRIFAGGHDHICGAFAAGIIRENMVLDSSGTSEEFLMISGDYERVTCLGAQGFNVGAHVVENFYYISGGIPASGASVDWFEKEIAGAHFPDLSMENEKIQNTILFLPHLRGSSSPKRDPAESGAFLGLRTFHTKEDMRQAVYEGLAFELKKGIRQLTDVRHPIIRAIGGGTKNQRWLQKKADILGVPIEVPSVEESTALGAAMLAGIGLGIYKNAEDAVKHAYKSGITVRPNPDLADFYQRKYEIFCEFQGCFGEVCFSLEQLSKSCE